MSISPIRLATAVPASPDEAARAAWCAAAAALILGSAALLWLFRDAAAAALQVWRDSATFNHGFLILPIAIYLAHERRAVFAAAHPAPIVALPTLAALLGAAAWLAAETATVYELQQFALVGLLQCLLLGVLGWRLYAALLFPCLYLFLLVPTGEQLVPALQDVTTWFILLGLDAIGIPNHADGVFIAIPSGDFHVAEACAGLRFLIASLAYGLLFADLAYRDWRRRALFVLLSVTVPILANGLRALGIVLIAHYSNHRYAVGVDHIVYGWGFFVAVTLLLTWLGWRWRDAPARRGAPDWLRGGRSPAPVGRTLVAAGAVLAAAATGPAYAAWLERVPARLPTAALTITPPGEPWREVPPRGAWRPVFANADAEAAQRFVLPDGRAVDAHLVAYAAQRKGAELIAFGNAPQDRRWRRIADAGATLPVDGIDQPVQLRRIAQGGTRRNVWFWYWVDGRFVASKLGVKASQIAGRLVTGRRAAAAILLSVEAVDDAEALATLRAFLAAGPRFAVPLSALAAPTR